MKLKFLIILLICFLIGNNSSAITYFVINNNDTGTGSLRQAIEDANGNIGLDQIYFNIADTSVSGRTINLLTALPALTDRVVIDGITQPGQSFGNSYAKVQITTSAAITSCFETESDSCSFYSLFIHNFQYGISITGAYAKIGAIQKGNVIYNCSIAAIKIQGTDHVAIHGNFIGLDTAENIIAGATGDGIYVTNSYAVSIGGKTYLAYNIISGNNSGIHLDNASFIDLNSNLIGTSFSAPTAKPNTYGIRGTGLNINIEIGGDSLFEKNVISGNILQGIYGNLNSSVIQGNLIGLDATGTTALPNGAEGILLTLGSSDNLIGGSDMFKHNTIAYNTLEAIVFQNSTCTRNTVTNNRIFCNGNGGGIVLNFGNGGIAAPQFLAASSAGVAGVTIPNGTIELFNDDSCVSCEGKSYITTLSASPSGSFTYVGNISGKITATVTDADGNTSAFADCVDTTALACIVAGFITSPPLCQNLSATFLDQSVTAPPTTLTSWNWDFGDGNTSTQQSPAHIYALGGSYTVQLITTNSDGCADTVTKSVTIGAAPSAGFSTLQGACIDQPFTFEDQSTTGSGSTLTGWSWDFGDASTSTDQNPVHTYTSTDTFTVTLTVTNNFGCTNTTVGVITVFPLPVASFNFLQAGLQVTFDNTSSFNGPHSSFWDFGDGGTSTLDDPTYTYAVTGIYNVCLTIYDSTCLVPSFACQVVDLPVGIDEETAGTETITISPNPAMGFVNFSVSGIEVEEVYLINAVGKEILHLQDKKFESGISHTIQLPEIAGGIYLLKMGTDKGVITRKVMIVGSE